ncbi:glycoside hydrolase family 15 protein [Nitrosococcus wardiae]|uniref:Trehalase n=1 Tax=Nitrosococcus wardiae TaxID=1814290 RepID=A0A4P7BVH8_9GAMM|nr:glycoside hydrolase family 15 protein [Nitrosococcus wardiae]QBQ54023.1 glycoside hydrolase family 15 protein [Nitrosococcus wardiae]
MSKAIKDYALISDCRTAALISQQGSIDWLCLPRFDSEACFAALLGDREHGHWQIYPEGNVRMTRRRYRDGTMILETEYHTASGTVCLTDFMVMEGAVPQLMRLVKGVSGEVVMTVELFIRFDYGDLIPWTQIENGRLIAVAGPSTVQLTSSLPLAKPYPKMRQQFVIREGQWHHYCLLWSESHCKPSLPVDPLAALSDTQCWWRDWITRSNYRGPWRGAVERSLLTLRALIYEPTGGMVAAPTTSLPEHPGGVRNWDYRFCWLRDATMTLYALMNAGYRQEAYAWREWLLRAVAGEPEQMQIMYGLAGERRLSETEIPWLPGYAGSRPIRIGNAAYQQKQLDVYGEIMDAFHLARRAGIEPHEAGWKVQKALMDYLESHWDDPDEGIWEVRSARRDFVHSKIMAWVAFDRAIKAVEDFGLDGSLMRWKNTRQKIHEEICSQGFDSGLNAFVQSYGSKELDASLLMIPTLGFLPADDPRVQGTVKAIESQLVRNGFVYRYSSKEGIDGLPQGEGAFLACSFWLADNYILQGQKQRGIELFEKLLAIRNDVGLLSEQYDPEQKALLGNFPQAFSHVSLINTATNLTNQHGPALERKK